MTVCKRQLFFIFLFWCGCSQAYPVFYTLNLTEGADVFGLAKVEGEYRLVIYIKGGINLPALPCQQGYITAAEALCRCIFKLSCYVDQRALDGGLLAKLKIHSLKCPEEPISYEVSASILWGGSPSCHGRETEFLRFQRQAHCSSRGLFLFNAPLILTMITMLKANKVCDDGSLIYLKSMSIRACSPYQKILSMWESGIKDTGVGSIIRLTGDETYGVFVDSDLIMNLDENAQRDFSVYTAVKDRIKKIGVSFKVVDVGEYKTFYKKLIAPEKTRRSKRMNDNLSKKKSTEKTSLLKNMEEASL